MTKICLCNPKFKQHMYLFDTKLNWSIISTLTKVEGSVRQTKMHYHGNYWYLRKLNKNLSKTI